MTAMEGATEQQAVRGAAGDVLPEPTDTQTTNYFKVTWREQCNRTIMEINKRNCTRRPFQYLVTMIDYQSE